MAKSILTRIDRNLARRMREARREVGFSTRMVASKLPRRLSVTHTTIAAYENGTATPPIEVLAALSDMYQRPLNWFLENREALEGFRYRNLRSRIRLSDQRQFEAQAGKWADAYFKLGQHLNGRGGRPIQMVPSVPSHENQPPTELAALVRKEFLRLDDDQPIQSMVHVLESFSAWALEIRTSFGIDSAAARRGDDFVVVLNPESANDRVRMTAAFELAHILYDDCKQHLRKTDADIEKMAYVFASSLLLPDSQLRAAFDGKSFLKLIQYKEKFGISLSAMIYMAEKSRIITTTTSRWLWKEMGTRGWRNNEPGFVWRDRAITFETMLECAVQGQVLTWADAERITGVREEELRARLMGAMTSEPRRNVEEHVPVIRFAPET